MRCCHAMGLDINMSSQKAAIFEKKSDDRLKVSWTSGINWMVMCAKLDNCDMIAIFFMRIMHYRVQIPIDFLLKQEPENGKNQACSPMEIKSSVLPIATDKAGKNVLT